MRKTILRRLDVLEAANRAREEKELSSLRHACTYVWIIVFAYYLGDLRLDERSPHEAHARALKYKSDDDFLDAIIRKEDFSGIWERYDDAHRQLFAKAGLDFHATPPGVLFEAFVTMVNQLPDQWLVAYSVDSGSSRCSVSRGRPREVARTHTRWPGRARFPNSRRHFLTKRAALRSYSNGAGRTASSALAAASAARRF